MYEISNDIRENYKIYLPINFWFSKDIGNSLPLVATINSEIVLKLKINSLDKLLYIEDDGYLNKIPKLKAKLLVQYIYLDNNERSKIVNSNLEYIADRYHTDNINKYEFKNIIDKKIKSEFIFGYPVKYLVWRVKTKERSDNKLDVLDWMYNGYRTRDSDNRLTVINNMFNNINIQFNNIVRETDKNFLFYNYVTLYSKKITHLDNGEYIYLFALNPLDLQPSGHVNMSALENIAIEHSLTDEFIDNIKNNDLIIDVQCFARTIQIIRIIKGFIAPLFI